MECNDAFEQRFKIITTILTKHQRPIDSTLNKTIMNATKLMENKIIIGGIEFQPKENTKKW